MRYAVTSLTLTVTASLLLLGGCQQRTESGAEFAATFQERLLDAKVGDIIEIPEGVHQFERGLSLRADGVTIRGAGMDKTVLSFKGQKAGAEGLLVNGDDFTIEDLTIEDSIGDGLKISESDNIIIRRVKVQWTGGPSTDNGAYGIYPVLTRNVLIEDSASYAASDAGIYVGQSRNVIVRNNHAESNVAGIEVENTVDADVYNNVATGNTGGILVFNMPGLSQQGGNIRVFNNKVIANNHENFGERGTPVASIPAGSGIVVNSNDDIEIFGNEVRDNATANILISSLWSTGYSDQSAVPDFDPYPERIYVHGNTLSGGGDAPDVPEGTAADYRVLKDALYGADGRFPDVLWDGYVNPAHGVAGPQICLRDVSGVINVDGPGGYANPSQDISIFACDLPALPAVSLNLQQY